MDDLREVETVQRKKYILASALAIGLMIVAFQVSAMHSAATNSVLSFAPGAMTTSIILTRLTEMLLS